MVETDASVRARLNQATRDATRQDSWLVGQASLTTFTYILADVVAVITAAIASSVFVSGTAYVTSQQRIAILIAVLLMWIVFNAGGLYTSWRGRDYLDHVRAVSFCWLSVVVLLVISAYLVGPDIFANRAWIILWTAIGLFTLSGVRVFAMLGLRTIRKHGLNHKKVVIVGGGAWGNKVIQRVQAAEGLGLDVVAVFDNQIEKSVQNIGGVPFRGGYNQLLDIVRRDSIDEVWICLPLGSSRAGGKDWIGEVMQILNDSTVTQRLLPELEDMRLLNRPVTEIIGLPVVNLNTSPLHGIGRFAKAIQDWLLAAVIIIGISPLLAAIAIAIKVDSPGPILFRQLRHGSDGKPFKMFKFRTMKSHCEENGTVTQARKNDPRVTKVGAFLRRNSLDELPQFLNVLKGDMSIVGPRPHAIEHNEYYRTQIDSYMQRHRVKPGITGWAQVNGLRGATESIEKMRRRVNLDLYYIEHWSMSFDLKILLRTIWNGFRGDNAY